MSQRISLDCTLNRNTATWATPTWEEIDRVKDLTLNLTKSEADASIRGSLWKLFAGTLKEGTISFQLQWDNAAGPLAIADALRDAFLNNTLIELAAMDNTLATSGAEGLRAEFEVMGFTRNEPLEGVVIYDVEVKPALGDNLPAWLDTA